MKKIKSMDAKMDISSRLLEDQNLLKMIWPYYSLVMKLKTIKLLGTMEKMSLGKIFKKSLKIGNLILRKTKRINNKKDKIMLTYGII